MTSLIVPVSLVFIVLLLLYHFSKRKFDYWKKRNVPFIKPVPFFGNYKEYILFKTYEGRVAQEICRKFPNAPYVGAFFGTEPMLLIQDPQLIKLIIAKDFYYFNGRAVSRYTHNDYFTQSLFFTYGDQWRVMRQNLTPLFSSAKMKNMFYLIENCATIFETLIEEEASNSSVVDVKSLMIRYTMDCIGSCAFGVNTNTMTKNVQTNPFIIMGDKIF